MTHNTSPKITFDDIVAKRIQKTLHTPLNKSFSQGDIVWIRGNNGSGKSTLLKIMAQILNPDSGRVTVCGQIAYLPHANGLYDHLTVNDHDQYHHMDGETSLFYTLPRDRYIDTLSKGEQRKVALDYFFQKNATILIMDEPFDALDQASQEQLRTHILKHAQNMIIFIAEHKILDFHTKILDLNLKRA